MPEQCSGGPTGIPSKERPHRRLGEEIRDQLGVALVATESDRVFDHFDDISIMLSQAAMDRMVSEGWEERAVRLMSERATRLLSTLPEGLRSLMTDTDGTFRLMRHPPYSPGEALDASGHPVPALKANAILCLPCVDRVRELETRHNRIERLTQEEARERELTWTDEDEAALAEGKLNLKEALDKVCRLLEEKIGHGDDELKVKVVPYPPDMVVVEFTPR